MSVTIENLKINGIEYADAAPRVKLSKLTLNWELDTPSISVVQNSYQVRIGTHTVNWGSDAYQPDVFNMPYLRTRSKYFALPEKNLTRGILYFGQVRARDTSGVESEWVRFRFRVNTLPFILDPKISPEDPGEGDDLQLSYTLPQQDANVNIRWFRNGVHYQQFDDYDRISREYIRYNDVWFAEIIPFNSLEKGGAVFTDSVTISKLPPSVSNLEILPRTPNENDILEASYSIIDQNTNQVLLDDRSQIVWYINDAAVDSANDSKFVRFQLRENDVVRFSVTPYDGVAFGETQTSPSVTVQNSGFRVINVRIDGKNHNLNVNSVNPTIQWDVLEPLGLVSQYAQISIGTAPGASNVYQTIVKTFDEQFSLPDNVVQRGTDYFVSVAASSSMDNFSEPSFGRFRVAGSLWNTSASNSTGWTIEVAARVEGEGGYQRFSFADGSRFAELRMYPNELQLFLGGANTKSVPIDLLLMKNVLIVGQGNTLKVFNQNTMIFDATDEFIAPASDRYIEVGSSANDDIIGHFKRVVYTVDGAFDPVLNSSTYSQIEFEPFITFTGEAVTDIAEHEGDILVSVNSRNPDQSGSIYRILETEEPALAATESVDKFEVDINSVSSSPNGAITIVSHNKGASLFENPFVDSFDVFTEFPIGRDPIRDLWENVNTTPFTAISYGTDGIIIDTTFSNQARVDSRILITEQTNVAALSFRDVIGINFFNFKIEITATELRLSIGDDAPFFTTGLNKTLDELAFELRDLNDFEDNFFSQFYKITVTSGLEAQFASNLNPASLTEIFPETSFSGSYLAADPYSPDPYSATAGGKWFYTHRKPGTAWVDKVNNSKGWTVDFDARIDSIEDSDRPSNISSPEGAGLYINDGKYYENIYFLPQEIVLGTSGTSFLIDTTELNRYRFVGQGDNLKVFAKRSSDPEYIELGEVVLQNTASNEGDAGRPSVYADNTGKAYAAWHDTGNAGKRQIYFSEYEVGVGWLTPELIVSENFDAGHPDIAVDGEGTVYIVFQTSRSDLTDIAAIQRTESGWSDAYLISSNIGKSMRPRIAIDSNNSVHVVWEDYRLGQPEIYYARRNRANGQWESGAFGQGDTRLTRSPAGARRPSICTRGLSVYVAWTSEEISGRTSIKACHHAGGGAFTTAIEVTDDATLTNWISSGQGEADFTISAANAKNTDHVDINRDASGSIIAAWEQVVDGVYQIFGRVLNSRLSFGREIVQTTTGFRDCRFPAVALDRSGGFVYVAFEKGNSNIADPYDPYDVTLDDPSFGEIDYSINVVRYNSSIRVWEGSNTSGTDTQGNSLGGFDVVIEEGDKRTARRPVVGPNIVDGRMHILYESGDVSKNNIETLNNDRLFYNIRDAIYDLTWEPVFALGLDSYADDDLRVSSGELRKEIRFGDFSNNIGTRMVINKVRYTTADAVEPFTIRLISSATVNMPRANVLSSASNNRGDAWLGTDDGLLYFNRRKNEVVVFEDTTYGVSGLEIRDIKFDELANMYVATDEGVFVSPDQAYFYKFTGENVPTSATSLDLDSKRKLFIGSNSGLAVIDTASLVSGLQTTSENVSATRTIDVPSVATVTMNEGMPTNTITKVRIDANDVVWVGTTQGLVRYKNGDLAVFTQANGLVSDKINDIGIRDTARRYLATSAGINKMVGVGIERLDFGNVNAPSASLSDVSAGDISIPKFNNVVGIRWQEPNHIIATTMHDLYQITFVDEPFETERPEITKFRSQDFTLVTISTERNDDLQTFRLIGLEDRDISKSSLYEVILNGNKITRGFKFSPDFRLIRFEYPLKESDIVQINIRFDVEVLNRFEQNQAEKLAEGTHITNVEKLLSTNGSIYAKTGGDINAIQINDETTDLPFDRIILDTEPPIGRIDINGQINRSTLDVLIKQVQSGDEYLPFDATSGIDKYIVSNFTNFTTDGETPQNPQPFTTRVNHPVDAVFDQVTQEYSFSGTEGRRLLLWQAPGENPILVAGTANPARIYIYNPITQVWDLRAMLDDGDTESSVEFLIQYQNQIFVGTGNPDGSGKIYRSTDGLSFTLSTILPVSYAYCAEVLDGVLYIGAGEPEGMLFSYNGTEYSTVFQRVSGSILDLVGADGELYAGTGDEGRIYRLDPSNLTQQILHTDPDSRILSVGFATVNGTSFVFSGSSESARIKRSKLPDGAFIHSFRTVNAPVYSMENVNGILWTSIGNTLFALENVWNAKYTHTENIRDISVGPDGNTWFISGGSIFKIGEGTETKRIYLKLFDRAGNETNLFTDAAQTQLDSNLFDEITLEELVGFSNANRILEVDEFGNTVSTIDGDDRFYSADKVDEEVGVYMSEIFNGTNGLVSWNTISWDVTIPSGTNMVMQVRTGTSRDDLLEAPFEIEFDGSSEREDISFVNGQYIQFKVIMRSQIRDLSPSLKNVVVASIASESTHFFTTNFVLPSRIKSGILTSTKMVPVAADIVFGINANNSVDFAEYQIIDENRIFTTDDRQVGENVRVGIRLITPNRGETIADEFGEYGPYDSLLFFNSLDWDFRNTSGSNDLYHFRVSFYEDMAMENLVYQGYSANSQSGWSIDGETFQSTGAPIDNNETVSLSFVPVEDTPIACNTYYWIKVEAVNSLDEFETVLEQRSFIEACGTTFVDSIDFDFTNETSSTKSYHFRVRSFTDPERTMLLSTAYSGNDTSGWYVNGNEEFPLDGVVLGANLSEDVTFRPDLSLFTPRTTYYLSIDVFDGSKFANQSNSFTFRARDIDSSIYCGPYVNVPVVNNFSIMFELEGNQFVTLKGS